MEFLTAAFPDFGPADEFAELVKEDFPSCTAKRIGRNGIAVHGPVVAVDELAEFVPAVDGHVNNRGPAPDHINTD